MSSLFQATCCCVMNQIFIIVEEEFFSNFYFSKCLQKNDELKFCKDESKYTTI